MTGRLLTHNGETHSVSEWARLLGISRQALWVKISSGMPLEDALRPKGSPPSATPKRKKHDEPQITFRNRTQRLDDWATELGIARETIQRRLDRGKTVEEALADPLQDRTSAPTPDVLTHDGRTLSIAEWAEEIGLRERTIRERIRNGWPIEKVLGPLTAAPEAPANRQPHMHTRDGETLSITAWAKRFGIQAGTVWSRIRLLGWDVDRALDTPSRGRR